MITFKEFLLEGSDGREKWEKYFSSGEVETLAKFDSVLYDAFGKLTKKTVKKGDKIKVLASDEYSTKLPVRVDLGDYLMKLTDIDKPFKITRAVGIDLKPDKLGLFGPKFMAKYAKEVKKLIDDHKEIPEPQGEYLKALVDHAENPDDDELKQNARDMFIMTEADTDSTFRNTVNNDFMEVLGPFFVVNEKPEYKAGGVKFPEDGSEPLYDFTMKAKRGDGERIDRFSSKRSGGNTNTLKMTSILDAVEKADSSVRKKYSREIQLMKLIDENRIKTAPDLINDWLAKTFPAYKKAPASIDVTSFLALESAVVKWINEHSKLNFTPLIQAAIPALWYVKARLNSDGTIKVEPLKSGSDIDKVKLRQKSSQGHIADKIGFVV